MRRALVALASAFGPRDIVKVLAEPVGATLHPCDEETLDARPMISPWESHWCTKSSWIGPRPTSAAATMDESGDLAVRPRMGSVILQMALTRKDFGEKPDHSRSWLVARLPRTSSDGQGRRRDRTGAWTGVGVKQRANPT